MRFEIINDKGTIVMNCSSIDCMPNKEQIDVMLQIGYKFKVDNRIISKKKIVEIIKEKQINEESCSV